MTGPAPAAPWLTTEQVAAEVGVSPATIRRWGRLGVLPAPTVVRGGGRGSHARWPLDTPDRAKRVQALQAGGFTWDEIRSALEVDEKPGE